MNLVKNANGSNTFSNVYNDTQIMVNIIDVGDNLFNFFLAEYDGLQLLFDPLLFGDDDEFERFRFVRYRLLFLPDCSDIALHIL